MTNEEAQKVLDELNTARIEMLNDKAKRLFEAIMKISDERDKIKQKYDRDTHILQNQLDLANAENVKKDKQIENYINMLATNDMLHIKESQEKDKVINLMVKVMIDSSICDYFIKQKCKNYAGENGKTCDECIKQYFKNKAKEILNK